MPKPHLTEQQVEDAINAVQKQQKESLQCMAFLKEQHEKWQDSVEQLLAQIRPEYNEVVCALSKPDTTPVTTPVPVTESRPLGTTEGLPKKPVVPREIPTISQDAVLAIDSTMMEAFQFQEKGPLKKVVQEILSDAAAKKMTTKELTGWELFRHKVAKIVDSKWFEWAAGCIILLNMITIGIEAELSLRSGNHDSIFSDMERTFLFIYTVELVVRLIAGGGAMFCNGWWILDFILVIVGVSALVIAPLLTTVAAVDFGGMEKLLIIRGLRLLRLVRALRMISYFKDFDTLHFWLYCGGDHHSGSRVEERSRDGAHRGSLFCEFAYFHFDLGTICDLRLHCCRVLPAHASQADLGLLLPPHWPYHLYRFDELGHGRASGKCLGERSPGSGTGTDSIEEQGEGCLTSHD